MDLTSVKKSYSDGSESVVYGYGKAGNRVEITDENGDSETEYDESGRVKKISDANGKILEVKDSNGITANYTYDKENHVTSIKRSDGTKTLYSYDKTYNLIKLEVGVKKFRKNPFKYSMNNNFCPIFILQA